MGGVVSLLGTNPIDPNSIFHIRSDINSDGRINAADRTAVLAARGIDLRQVLPACPLGRDGTNGGGGSNVADNDDIVKDPVRLDTRGPVVKLSDPAAVASSTAFDPNGPPIRSPEGSSGAPSSVTLAIRTRGDVTAADRDLLADFDFDISTLNQLPIPGWATVAAPAKYATANDAASLATQLSAQGIFTAPVKTLADGTVTMPTDALLVQFKAGVPDSWARQVLALHVPVSSTIAAGFAGEGSVYVVSGGFASGYDVLSAAKHLAARGDVVAASADDIRLRSSDADSSIAAIEAITALLVGGQPENPQTLLSGDFRGRAVDISFAPGALVGSGTATPQSALLAAMIDAAASQGRPVVIANLWESTIDPTRSMTTRSSLLRAAMWAQQHQANLVHLDSANEQGSQSTPTAENSSSAAGALGTPVEGP